MARISIEPIASYAGGSRWDAEYYTSDQRPLIEAMLAHWPDWQPLDDAVVEMSSGHTPADHDLEVGDAGLITIDCVEPLFLDRSRFKHVLPSHVEGQLKRARVAPGDVVTTIKRRLLNASPVSGFTGPLVCNQDVVRLRPANDVLPGFLAAVLNSRIGKAQALRNATEQINPYLSVPSLRTIRIPVVDPAAQAPIHALVEERQAEFAACTRLEQEAETYLAEKLGLLDVSTPPQTVAIAKASALVRHQRLDAEFFCHPDMSDVWRSPYEMLPLGDPRVTRRLASGATPAASDYAEEGVPIIKVGSVTAFGLAEWRGDRVRPESAAARGERGECRLNDVVMLSAAHHVKYIGRAGLLRRLPDGRTTCRAVGELITVRASDALTPETLVTYLNLLAVRRQVQRLVRGQSAHLYASDLQALPVPLVPDEVQATIGERLATAFGHRARAGQLAAEAMGRVEQLVLGE